jgi:hypothetical protein
MTAQPPTLPQHKKPPSALAGYIIIGTMLAGLAAVVAYNPKSSSSMCRT